MMICHTVHLPTVPPGHLPSPLTGLGVVLEYQPASALTASSSAHGDFAVSIHLHFGRQATHTQEGIWLPR